MCFTLKITGGTPVPQLRDVFATMSVLYCLTYNRAQGARATFGGVE